MEEKLKKANQLQKKIERASEVLSLINESQSATGENKGTDKINNLHSIQVSSRICTGSQSQNYSESFWGDTELLNRLALMIAPVIEDEIKKWKSQLKELFS